MVPLDVTEELISGFSIQSLGIPFNHLTRAVVRKNGTAWGSWVRAR